MSEEKLFGPLCSKDQIEIIITLSGNKIMKVGIIGGTGGMGKGFALRWSQNHDVIIGSRDATRASESAVEIYKYGKRSIWRNKRNNNWKR